MNRNRRVPWTSEYFTTEVSYPQLKPLKDNWRLFRKEVEDFIGDDHLNKNAFRVGAGARKAMRSKAELWKIMQIIMHNREPEDFVRDYGVSYALSAELRQYVRQHHFKDTRRFIFDYAAVPSNGVISAFFSYFEPGARLGLHVNQDPYMYRAHLGLIVPEGDIGFKVCDETMKWKEGEILVFDSTNPHTAWNLTEEPRIVLILDFFRPEEDRSGMEQLERAQFALRIKEDPNSLGMSGGSYDVSEDARARYAVPRIERPFGVAVGRV